MLIGSHPCAGSDTHSPLGAQYAAFYSELSPSFGIFGQSTAPVNHSMPETAQDLSDYTVPNLNSARLRGFGQTSMPTNHRFSETTLDLPDPAPGNPMSRRVYEVVVQLTNTYITLPKGHFAKVPSTKIAQADSFFTLSNVQAFTQTYFHHFHPHFSVIHRPSFDSTKASTRLLLAVCLAGSLYSSVPHNVARCKSFLDLAEEHIFADIALRRLAKGAKRRETDGTRLQDPDACLEVLQAGLVIVLLQNWEGSKAAQRRARLDRLQQLVSVSRILCRRIVGN